MKLYIKEIRERRGFSIRQLSELSGISKTYIAELERGTKKNASMKVLCRLAKALDVHVSVLFNCDE
ncbi:helix-turn-helix transcriptional regulator [Crassaminicella thermophila]|uniref:Helix-turn-helix transcriptional regulator n=1 Tax=Crassaminicella thermophila TaxID=2599308 RepID=A0A5C0SAQ4_CRATE|nr:helix-turn-helix transcriptional regulator [Crassaminicella thermophila]